MLAAAMTVGCYRSHEVVLRADAAAPRDGFVGDEFAPDTGSRPLAQRVVYLQTREPNSEFRRPVALHSVRLDGSDAQELAQLDPETLRAYIAGVESGLVTVYSDLNGIGATLHFASSDGSMANSFEVMDGVTVFADADGAWLGGLGHLAHVGVDGTMQSRTNMRGRPQFLSPRRQWAYVRHEQSACFARVATGDCVATSEAVMVTEDALCWRSTFPSYWPNGDETTAFVYPTETGHLAKLRLDGSSSQTSVVGTDDFEPIVFDQCNRRLVTYRAGDGIYSVTEEDRVTQLASLPADLGIHHFKMSPDARYLVVASTVARDRRIYIVDLDAGTVDSLEVPTPHTIQIGNVTNRFAVVGTRPHPGGPDEPHAATRIELASAIGLPAPHCGHAQPWVTDDGRVLLCQREGDSTHLRVGTPGNEFTTLGRGPTEVVLLPEPTAPGACALPPPPVLSSRVCI